MKLKQIKGLVPEERLPLFKTSEANELLCAGFNNALSILGESEVGVDVEEIEKVIYPWIGSNISRHQVAQALSASIEKWLVKK